MNQRLNELTSPYWAEGQEEADITSVLKLIKSIDENMKISLTIERVYIQLDGGWAFYNGYYHLEIPHKDTKYYTPQETEDLLTLLEKLLWQKNI